jgi:hypothetical protein
LGQADLGRAEHHGSRPVFSGIDEQQRNALPELAAVEDGLAAYEKLIANLKDVPTPDRLLQIEPAQSLPSNESEKPC